MNHPELSKMEASRDQSKGLSEATRMYYGKQTAKELADYRKSIRTRTYDACHYCGEPPPDNGALKRCAKCQSIGRRVPYCSRWVSTQSILVNSSHLTNVLRECQRSDWKHGRSGRPHKQICGKPLQDSSGAVSSGAVHNGNDAQAPSFDIMSTGTPI
jgi:hypothetical protein